MERFGISVGDVMRFDVLGRPDLRSGQRHSAGRMARRAQRRIHVRIRRRDIRERAALVYRAGACAASRPTQRRARLTHDLVVRFPNVSVIDFREILEAVRKVFQVVTVAIDVVGSLVILTGGLILVGAVAVTKFQRSYEAAIFKTLGASSRAIAAMLMVEYGLLGTLAGAVGSFGALALGWGVSRYALDIPVAAGPA